jgi:hypothetical protein
MVINQLIGGMQVVRADFQQALHPSPVCATSQWTCADDPRYAVMLEHRINSF